MSNRKGNFETTYLRAQTDLDKFLADLGFSARVHFFLHFFSKIFYKRKSYRGLIFYEFELRCDPDYVLNLCYGINSEQHRRRSKMDVFDFVLLELLAQSGVLSQPEQNIIFEFKKHEIMHQRDPNSGNCFVGFPTKFRSLVIRAWVCDQLHAMQRFFVVSKINPFEEHDPKDRCTLGTAQQEVGRSCLPQQQPCASELTP